MLPSLDTHQLRVAAVAKTICDSFKAPVNVKNVILTCLFHDMGNIIKSNFDHFPDFFASAEERAYWETVKLEYIQKYGPSEHHASLAIAEELGLPEEVCHYIAGIGFSNLKTTSAGVSFEEKICEYADLRVGPYGVLSLIDRIADIHRRYAGRNRSVVPEDEGQFEELRQAALDMQGQIFAETSIRPEDITDASITPLIEELRNYQVA